MLAKLADLKIKTSVTLSGVEAHIYKIISLTLKKGLSKNNERLFFEREYNIKSINL
jgi:hypothetical protein